MSDIVRIDLPRRRSHSERLAQDAIRTIDAAATRRLLSDGDVAIGRVAGVDPAIEQLQQRHHGSTSQHRSVAVATLSVAISVFSLGISLFTLFDGAAWVPMVLILASTLSFGFFLASGIFFHRSRRARHQESLFDFLGIVGTRSIMGRKAWWKAVWKGENYDLAVLRYADASEIYAIENNGRFAISYGTATDDVVRWMEGVSENDVVEMEEALSAAGVRVVRSGARFVPPPDVVSPASLTVH